MTFTAVTDFYTTTRSLANRFYLQTELARPLTSSYDGKNPRIDNIHGFFLVKRLGKPL